MINHPRWHSHFSGPSIFNVLTSGASTLFSLFSGGGGGAQDRIGVADDDGEGGSTTTYSTASYGPTAALVVRAISGLWSINPVINHR